MFLCNKREGRGFLSAKREKGNDLCFGKYFTKNLLAKHFTTFTLKCSDSQKMFSALTKILPKKKKKDSKILKKNSKE